MPGIYGSPKPLRSKSEQNDQSDFLCYRNHAGLYADFHSCRHLFITSLERAGVSPKMAQTLARHSDIRLTMNIYSHVDEQEQAEAIARLPVLFEKCWAVMPFQHANRIPVTWKRVWKVWTYR